MMNSRQLYFLVIVIQTVLLEGASFTYERWLWTWEDVIDMAKETGKWRCRWPTEVDYQRRWRRGELEVVIGWDVIAI